MARPSEDFFERNVFQLGFGLAWAWLGPGSSENFDVEWRSCHLFLSSGPPLAKAWAENLGAKVGGFGFGGALLGALAAKMDKKILALTSSFF